MFPNVADEEPRTPPPFVIQNPLSIKVMDRQVAALVKRSAIEAAAIAITEFHRPSQSLALRDLPHEWARMNSRPRQLSQTFEQLLFTLTSAWPAQCLSFGAKDRFERHSLRATFRNKPKSSLANLR